MSLNELREHKKEYHSNVFKCDKCNLKCISLEKVNEHKNRDHLKKPSCDFYDFIGNDDIHLQRHVDNAHSWNKYCCDVLLDENYEKKHNNKAGAGRPPLKNYCYYWNYGECDYGRNSGNLHEEIPACSHAENCSDQKCSFFHPVSSRPRKRPSFKNKAWVNFILFLSLALVS